jgi:regulator of protease activity HflC (stomatin/prohibitin superfamily)
MDLIFQLAFSFILFIVAFSVLAYSIRIIPQSQALVVERLGAYHTTHQMGLHFVIPILDRVANKVSLKEYARDFVPQPVITKDNVTMMIDTVVYYNVFDPKLYTYGIHNPVNAIEMLSATTLRNIIGDLELDETLTSRDIINSKMRVILDEATDPWGIKVNRVEVKNIIPPKDIQEAMEKQMRAERERRSAILLAEGEKRSAILSAEGEKESLVLRAEAKKEALIAEAEGQAQALERVYQAQARGIDMINKANPHPAFITLKSLEALEKVADGKATKIIIPSEIQNLASMTTALKTFWEEEKQ